MFVLPSQIEGLSTGLLEAMAARRCIVASALPENLEALGDTGLTFPAGDVEQLASSLQAALADGALRERMGAAAAARVCPSSTTGIAQRNNLNPSTNAFMRSRQGTKES